MSQFDILIFIDFIFQLVENAKWQIKWSIVFLRQRKRVNVEL